MVGNDADLIMLSLLVSTLFLKENLIYILREDLTSKKLDYLLVNINQFKRNIFDFALSKPNFKHYDFDRVVCDFVIMCFMVGNDFLPSIPLFNIYDGGLDLVMKYYFTTPGYITFKNLPKKQQPKVHSKTSAEKIKINFDKFKDYFQYILEVVTPRAVEHYKTREYGYANKLLDISARKETSYLKIATHYLNSYALHHNSSKKLVFAYLDEIQWIFNYYAYGGSTVDWKMYYPSQFAPTSIDLHKYLDKYSTQGTQAAKIKKTGSYEIEPFFQLLCILPPHSSDLLPEPLNKILGEEMVEFHPTEIKIDYEGKLNEWEGIPLLPPLNYEKIFEVYTHHKSSVKEDDLKRNTVSKQLLISVV